MIQSAGNPAASIKYVALIMASQKNVNKYETDKKIELMIPPRYRIKTLRANLSQDLLYCSNLCKPHLSPYRLKASTCLKIVEKRSKKLVK
jgi:hypothetical protein